jgi:hypothetical protein
MTKIDPPSNWTGGGELPDPSESAALWEDLVQLRSPDGTVLDVSWLPQGDPDGQYTCVVIVDRDWQHPLRKIVTKDVAVVQRWIKDEVVRLSAPPTKRRREV